MTFAERYSELSSPAKLMFVLWVVLLIATIAAAAWHYLMGGDVEIFNTAGIMLFVVTFLGMNVWAMQPITLKRIPPPADWTNDKGPTLH
jgi:hypothetical protein